MAGSVTLARLASFLSACFLTCTASGLACSCAPHPAAPLPDAPVVWHSSQSDDWGGLRVATRGEGDIAVVLLHGYGARGDDLVDFAARLHDVVPALYVIPRGPIESHGEHDGRAWFDPPSSRQRTARDRREASREAAQSGARLEDILSTLDARGIPRERVIVAGFSQGAFMSATLALCGERRVAGIALMSGTELPRCADFDLASGVPVFVAHGTSDRVLPMADGMEAARELDAAGAQVEPYLFAGGHVMTRLEREALVVWLSRVVEDLQNLTEAERDTVADGHGAATPR